MIRCRRGSALGSSSGAALLCTLLVVGSQLCLSAAAIGGQRHPTPTRSRHASRRALLQEVNAVDPMGPNVLPDPADPMGSDIAGTNATGLALEALNTTSAAQPNRTMATIFAPTDAAFEALATALNLTSPLDLFNGTYNQTAANITALHVIPGEEITTANLTTTPNITAPTLLGFNITVSTLPNGTVTVTVPGSDVVAHVITPNVPFNNSIVHVIDRVLLPPAIATASWAVPLPPPTEIPEAVGGGPPGAAAAAPGTRGPGAAGAGGP